MSCVKIKSAIAIMLCLQKRVRCLSEFETLTRNIDNYIKNISLATWSAFVKQYCVEHIYRQIVTSIKWQNVLKINILLSLPYIED